MFISRSSRGWEVQDQENHRFGVWWEPAFCVSQMALFSLSSHGRKRVREHSEVSFIRTLIPFMRVSPSKLIASQRTSLRIPSEWGLGIGIWIPGRHNSQSTAESFSELRNRAWFWRRRCSSERFGLVILSCQRTICMPLRSLEIKCLSSRPNCALRFALIPGKSHLTFVYRLLISLLEARLPRWFTGKNPPAKQEMWAWSLGPEDTLVKRMASLSNILAWETPWTEEPGGLQSRVTESQSRIQLSERTHTVRSKTSSC